MIAAKLATAVTVPPVANRISLSLSIMRFHLRPYLGNPASAERAHFHVPVYGSVRPNPVVATNRIYPLNSVREIIGYTSGVGHMPHEFELATFTLNRDKSSCRNWLALDLNLSGDCPPGRMVGMFPRSTFDHFLALSVCRQSKGCQSRVALCLGFGMRGTNGAQHMASVPLCIGAPARPSVLALPRQTGQVDARGADHTAEHNLDHAGMRLATLLSRLDTLADRSLPYGHSR